MRGVLRTVANLKRLAAVSDQPHRQSLKGFMGVFRRHPPLADLFLRAPLPSWASTCGQCVCTVLPFTCNHIDDDMYGFENPVFVPVSVVLVHQTRCRTVFLSLPGAQEAAFDLWWEEGRARRKTGEMYKCIHGVGGAIGTMLTTFARASIKTVLLQALHVR